MGIYDRDYNRPYQENYSAIGGGFKSIPPVVKWLLIINFAVFIVGNLIFPPSIVETATLKTGEVVQFKINLLDKYFSVYPKTTGMALQLWRVVTYQFLHGGLWHIVFNLMVLYFMGPFVERAWGSKAFLKFYLICGAAGGVIYTLLVKLGILTPPLPMVGASGGIYGLMAAIVIMYPRMKVLLYGIIPMTMTWLVSLAVIFSLINIAIGENVGGEAAHLTGLAVGFLYVFYKPMVTKMRMERNKGNWARKVEQERSFQAEVDRILDKVHNEGLQSLTDSEKKMLQEATRREQKDT
jgi:membrane associated rhomboid family serine protease